MKVYVLSDFVLSGDEDFKSANEITKVSKDFKEVQELMRKQWKEQKDLCIESSKMIGADIEPYMMEIEDDYAIVDCSDRGGDCSFYRKWSIDCFDV